MGERFNSFGGAKGDLGEKEFPWGRGKAKKEKKDRKMKTNEVKIKCSSTKYCNASCGAHKYQKRSKENTS